MPSQTTEFESLLEAVPDAIVGVDQAGAIRFVNRQAESLFGYDRGDLIGMPIEKLVPESLRMVHKVHRQSYNAAPRTRSMGTNLKLSGLRRDGTEFPVDISLSAREVADGLLVIAAVRDMTRYDKAESARRLDRLSAAVEFSGEAITSATLDGLITSWNPAAEKLYGYTREEMLGKPLQSMTPGDRLDEMLTVIGRVRAGEVVEDFETVRVRKDRTEFPVSLNISPIRDGGPSGTIIGMSVTTRDLTEKREALRSAQLMATIVQNSNEAIISSTADGIITSWNPAAEGLYGYPSEERIGKSAHDLVPEDRKDEIKTILAKVRAGQPVEHLETTRVRKDGTVFPVSLTVSPIRDVDGAVLGASVVARDISEQLRALESAQRLAAIVEQSQDAIIGKSLDGNITSWNPAAERMFGYSSEEIIGKPGSILGPESRADEIQDILAAFVSGQPSLHIETIRLRKDGTEFPVSLTASPIRDANGAIVGASGMIHDLTEQQRTFESSRSMIEASLDAFLVIGPDGKITDANQATVTATGAPRDELIGTSFSDYFTNPRKADEIYQKALEQGAVTDYPLTLRHRNGHETLTEVLYNASVFRDAAGNVLGVFAAARDVTEQKKAARYARSLFEAALDPMVTISPDGTITDTNEATVRATGVPREKLIGTSFSDYFTNPERAEEIHQQVFEQGAVTDYPLTLRHRNGHETLTEVLYNASLYRDEYGHVLGVFAAARDVTKQVRAQKEIAERQARELERLAELERFQRLTVGRELKMIELKKEIEYLRKYGPRHGGEPGDNH